MKKAPYLYILIAATLWGTIGAFARVLGAVGLASMQLTALRSYVACIALVILVLIKDKTKFRIRFKDVWCFIGTGIISFVFFNYCYFQSVAQSSISIAAILLYTAPIFVMLLSLLLFKEKMTFNKALALALAFAGCLLATGIGGTLNVTTSGLLFGLGSGFFYGLYTIFGHYALERYDSLTVTVYTFIFASLGSLPFADLSPLPAMIGADPMVLVEIIAFGLLTTVLPFLLYTKGLSMMESSKASILATAELIVATLLGTILFQEPLHFTNAIGLVIVVAALIILNIKPRDKPLKPPTI